ncbi:MAG: aldo/keto reductase [Candidatus Heimdallarchaeota archaeon]|nr:MAG: aldo/keto reductase [Candidatus Heimdallarchaeota archaeon]
MVIQAVLVFLWSISETTVPIPGARTVEQIKENTGTMEFDPLSSNIIERIDVLFTNIRRDLSVNGV